MLQEHLLQQQYTTQMHQHVCLTPLSALWTTDRAEIECPRKHVCYHTPWRITVHLYSASLTCSEDDGIERINMNHACSPSQFFQSCQSKKQQQTCSRTVLKRLVCARSDKMSRKGRFLRVALPKSPPAETKLIKTIRMSALIIWLTNFLSFVPIKEVFPFFVLQRKMQNLFECRLEKMHYVFVR